ncbi:uncharacterized protein LOC124342817 [Daphnia pulicaria]|nr:uncharacterized protein LOC124342817 [Daphnia pulicaria]
MSAEHFLWHLYGTTISQGVYFPCRQPSQKLLVATWCFATFVFVNIYNSTLRSYMSVTYQRPEINSFRDLATATNYKATVLIGSIQDIDLRVVMERYQNGDLKMIADRVKKCALDCRKFSFDELAVSVLEQENCVSILPFSAGVALLGKYNFQRSCRLAMAFESTSWKPMYLAVPKSSPYKEEIQRASLWFYDTGLRDHWFDVYEKPPGQCRLDYNSKGVATKRSSNQIKLEQLHLPFLILFGGYLIAFMQFLREKFICPLQ